MKCDQHTYFLQKAHHSLLGLGNTKTAFSTMFGGYFEKKIHHQKSKSWNKICLLIEHERILLYSIVFLNWEHVLRVR